MSGWTCIRCGAPAARADDVCPACDRELSPTRQQLVNGQARAEHRVDQLTTALAAVLNDVAPRWRPWLAGVLADTSWQQLYRDPDGTERPA